MKILIVANHNKGRFAPFVSEQAEALRAAGCEVAMFGLVGHGVAGYLKNLQRLRQALREEKPDLIHAHYGLCGLMANLQRRVPVVTTYHGTDINHRGMRRLSRLAMRGSAYNIFVSQPLMEAAAAKRAACVMPCGVTLEDFPLTNRDEARRQMHLAADRRYVLFASTFDNPVKNAPLAQAAAARVGDVELLEMKGLNRKEVAMMLRAVDCVLMTSHSEGSPQVVKEAMACGTPVVSVKVGDVAWVTEGVEGCYLTEPTPEAVAAGIEKALAHGGRTNGRQRIADLGLTNDAVARRLVGIYTDILKKKKQ